MRILDKYITKDYLKLYLIFTLFFISIFLITDFFTSISNLKKEAAASYVIQFYLLQIPYLFTLLSPLSAIISTLFLITHLGGTYQIQAAQIGGIPVKRVVLPLFTIGLIISFSILFLNETLIFRANQRAQELKEENFLGPPKKEVQKNIFIQVPPYYLFYIRSFNPQKGEMENILIYKESPPNSIIIAKKGKWVEGEWIFYQGIEYLLNEEIESTSFYEKKLPIDKGPAYFSRKYFPPDKMSIAELRKYIDEYEKSGFKTLDLETELNYKLSYPFTNFILILLGIPIGLILKKGGRGTSLALGLIISFGYYEAIAFFTTLGKGGFISPFLATWIPSLIFLTGGIYLFTHIERA